MNGPRILLIVGGGVAAYKSCELVRLIRKQGGEVTCILTEGGSHFVTPMALAALSENPVYTTLWDLKNEVEMGHIQLSRAADLIVVCPATADLLAKMAAGIADDLATTTLLATDTPVMAVPAMNVRMWEHAATQRNAERLKEAGVDVMRPDEGPMACGEFGPGRLPEPAAIWNRIAWALDLGRETYLPLEGGLPALSHDSDEGESDDDSLDFGGLSGSLVARGELPDPSQPHAEIGQAGAWDGPETLRLAIGPADGTAGGVTATKGGAQAAPPTDPEAINHLAARHSVVAAPEPFAGEVYPGNVASAIPEAPARRSGGPGPLTGKHVLVTAGPTWEPIDPVRYIANRSSGKQGYAIAAAAAAAGARVTLVSGPVHLPTPPGVDRIDVETALQMAEAVKRALPADIAVMVAAVADWRTARFASSKIKKRGSAPPALLLTENPDILATVAARPDRPPLLIGFAAETDNVIKHAQEKRKRKGVDWIIANDVSGDVMGGDANAVHIVRGDEVVSLPQMPKEEVARHLVERMADALAR
jgi:phosphopantothenoylcysteine decarboxylase / phosphopantothenate---cysteine ligase